jgi:DNA-binding MarR family transcriptional regulator
MQSIRPAKPSARRTVVAAGRSMTANGRGVAALRGKQYEPHVPGFDYDALDQMVTYCLVRAKLVIYEDLSEVMGSDLTAVQFTALILVGANPGIKQTDLSRILAVTPSAVVAIVDALARRGLVRRHAQRADRRAKAVRLTAKGKARLALYKARVMAYDRRVSRRLTEAEREQLLALLGKLG